MGNALIASPINYTVAGGSATPSTTPWSNVALDEPGLISSVLNVANGSYAYVDLNLSGNLTAHAVAFIGLNSTGLQSSVSSYPSPADRGANTSATTCLGLTSIAMSTYRTSDTVQCYRKFSNNTNNRFVRVRIYNNTGSTITIQVWRILILHVCQPNDNIEIQAEWGIDDRSNRAYTRTGRRVIDPTVIVPTVSGAWPWLSENEYFTFFLPFIRRHGGSYPVLFVQDPDDATYGEMHMIYGDLEKNLGIVLEDGDLYSYKFAIVAIAA